MELSDEKLRQLVRETWRELGDEAAPEVVRKIVRDVIRRLQLKETPVHPTPARPLPNLEPPAAPAVEKSGGAAPGY